MSDQSTQQEPSMEEILASIRRIISEDGDDAGGGDPAPEGSADTDQDEDVLELTDVAEEPANDVPEPDADDEDSDIIAIDRQPEPEPDLEPESEIKPEPHAEPEPESEPEPEPDFEPEPLATAPLSEPEPASDDEKSLMSPEAAAAATAAFNRLSQDMRTSSGSPRTLEDLVQDLLRPMMKQWLDENLPEIVEAAVGEEIERVSRRGRRR